MNVRLSTSARAYLRQEAIYLRTHSRIAADTFLQRMRVAAKDLGLFAESGFEGEELQIPGMRRLIRGGYRIDYKVEDGQVLIAAISSSINTPLDLPGDDDDFNYES